MAASATKRADGEREFRMRDSEFQAIAAAIYAHAGIVLGEHKKELVYSRLARRIRELGLADFKDYIDYLNGPNKLRENGHLINALTTNHTHFFREEHHFEHIAKEVVPRWKANAKKTGSKKLRFWSAGCSTGEEPYTLAMTVAHALASEKGWDWRILATDIDTKVLDHAKQAHYKADIAKSVPPAIRAKYISKLRGDDTKIAIDPSIKPHMRFNHLNLHGSWPMTSKFDLIFCRNVTIYFDAKSKQTLVSRFRQFLKPDGFLYLGHSESILGEKADFHSVGRTIYAHSKPE